MNSTKRWIAGWPSGGVTASSRVRGRFRQQILQQRQRHIEAHAQMFRQFRIRLRPLASAAKPASEKTAP